MGSPLDSLLRLIDSSGRVLAWNDDHEDQESGLLTHQADHIYRPSCRQPDATSCRSPMPSITEGLDIIII